MRRSFLAIALVASAATHAAAQAPSTLTLGPLFQDHAVLQRDRALPIWGTAPAGEQVTVAVAGTEVTARADAAGTWKATVPALAAGGPHSLEIRTSGGQSKTLSDVLVGDVFLCSGQSNMEFGVGGSRGGEFALMRSANEKIRVLSITHASAPQPARTFETTPAWQAAGPESLRRFSAACYFFGREVHEAQRVPVGLVNASWGGAAAEPFIGDSGLRAAGGFDARLDILKVFAKDEEAANQQYGRLWEDWWRGHGASAGEPWKPQDAGTWTDVPALTNWKTWGVPELASHDGMVWYRRSFGVTAAQAAQPATLSLGGIDEVDQTWVNGRVIRNTFGWGTPRSYGLPAGTLHAGDNLVVVNVLSTWDMGGLMGPADTMALTFKDGTKVAIGDGWRYRVAPLAMGRAPRAPWEPISGLTTIYNAMIAPMGPYGFRAAAWYQGETNADSPAGYEKVLAALMASWRSQFEPDLPFLVVQLPNFGAVPTRPVEANWADLREAQRRAVAADRHAALVVTIDIGEAGDLHPSNKRDVGRRLARAARKVVYGEAIAPSGPVPVSARREATGVAVTLGDIEKNLVTYSADVATGFELCGSATGSCRFVAGRVDGSRIVLPVAASDPAPTRVRFCWGASPICNLSDASGLPVGPFELDVQ